MKKLLAIIFTLLVFGCKKKVENPAETPVPVNSNERVAANCPISKISEYLDTTFKNSRVFFYNPEGLLTRIEHHNKAGVFIDSGKYHDFVYQNGKLIKETSNYNILGLIAGYGFGQEKFIKEYTYQGNLLTEIKYSYMLIPQQLQVIRKLFYQNKVLKYELGSNKEDSTAYSGYINGRASFISYFYLQTLSPGVKKLINSRNTRKTFDSNGNTIKVETQDTNNVFVLQSESTFELSTNFKMLDEIYTRPGISEFDRNFETSTISYSHYDCNGKPTSNLFGFTYTSEVKKDSEGKVTEVLKRSCSSSSVTTFKISYACN